jgi:hypothetical protein
MLAIVGMEMGISGLLPSLVAAYVVILSIVGSYFAKHGDRISKKIMDGINKLMPQAHR